MEFLVNEIDNNNDRFRGIQVEYLAENVISLIRDHIPQPAMYDYFIRLPVINGSGDTEIS